MELNLKPCIVVIGGINMDIVIEADRMPSIGESVFGRNIHFFPGGKGSNQAVAAARLGAKTTMIGAVGRDAFGKQLLDSLQSSHVDTSTVKAIEGEATGTASIVLTSGDNCIIAVLGANSHCTAADIDTCEQIIAQADIVMVQLEIPLDTVCYAAETAKRHGVRVVLNPAPAKALPDALLRNTDYITPNESELALLTGTDVIEDGMRQLLARGAKHVVTTLGREGAAYLKHGDSISRAPAHQVEVVDTTGAGDAFNAGLAYALAVNKPLDEAVDFAIAVSALAVTKLGAQPSMPTRDEVQAFLSRPLT